MISWIYRVIGEINRVYSSRDTVPATTFKMMTEDGPKDISSADVFDGKKVVFFAVPELLRRAAQ